MTAPADGEGRGAGTLFVAATPIGNLEDASPRLRRVLASSALVLCEDTRRTGRLLEALGVTAARLLSCHEHDEARRVRVVLERLGAGADVVLVSDAGTPCIADPGHLVVRAAREAGRAVVAVPGPSAVLAALSVSSLPTDAFAFEGFLPRKRNARRRLLASLADEPRTLVLLETPHRIADALDDLADVLGEDRPAFLAREITKLHEEGMRGTLGSLRDAVAARGEVRGEITLVVGGARGVPAGEAADAVARVEQLVSEGVPEREALRRTARELHLTRREIYAAVKLAPRRDDAEE